MSTQERAEQTAYLAAQLPRVAPIGTETRRTKGLPFSSWRPRRAVSGRDMSERNPAAAPMEPEANVESRENKPRRGRPVGSKNKPKETDAAPTHAVQLGLFDESELPERAAEPVKSEGVSSEEMIETFRANKPFAMTMTATHESLTEAQEMEATLNRLLSEIPVEVGQSIPDIDTLKIKIVVIGVTAKLNVKDMNGNPLEMVSHDFRMEKHVDIPGTFWAVNGDMEFLTPNAVDTGKGGGISLKKAPQQSAEREVVYALMLQELNTRNMRLGLKHPKQRVCPICQTRFFPSRVDQVFDKQKCQNVHKQRAYRARHAAEH